MAHYCDLSTALREFDPPQPASKPTGGSREVGEAAPSAAGAGHAPDSSAAGSKQGGDDSSGRGSSGNGGGGDYSGASDADGICEEVAQGVPFLGAEPPAQEPAGHGPSAETAHAKVSAEQAAAAPASVPADLEQGAPLSSRARQPAAASADSAADAYYSSVPAAAGAALQRQLQSALLASRQPAKQAQQHGSAGPQSGSLPASPRDDEGAASRTLSAASARQLQQRLSRQLASLRQQPAQQAQQAEQASSGPPSPTSRPAGTSMPSLPERHAFTLSGAAGEAAWRHLLHIDPCLACS